MNELHLKSFAKVNLSLRILGLREDRFHEIDSTMQSVSLHDDITLLFRDSGIDCSCDHPAVPQNEGNIAYNAAKAFFDFTKINKGASIAIKKHIPPAAGLAGGSSNAAAVLIGLDKMFETRLSKGELQSLGASAGSDVPFCLSGGRCRVRGRGEVVELLAALQKMCFVIVIPDIEVNTKWAYEEYDRWSIKTRGTLKQAAGPMAMTMHNDMEQAISEKFNVVREIKEALLRSGATSCAMSGSGPSVFGLVLDEQKANMIAREMEVRFTQVFVASSVNYGVKIV